MPGKRRPAAQQTPTPDPVAVHHEASHELPVSNAEAQEALEARTGGDVTENDLRQMQGMNPRSRY